MKVLINTLVATIFSYQVFANELYRPYRPSDYSDLLPSEKVTGENAVWVEGAEVAWYNRVALVRDFPELVILNDFEMKQWLLNNLALVGSKQQQYDGLRNSKIPINQKIIKEEPKVIYRPPSWFRSGELEVFYPGEPDRPMGMVSIKGVGHGALSDLSVYLQSFKNAEGNNFQLNVLRNQKKTDGLISLGEAIAEVSRQQAAQMLLDMRSDVNIETVESYAIIRLPFNILKENGIEVPAALYIRQASIGRFADLAVPKNIFDDPRGHFQQTMFGGSVDFGAVIPTDPMLQTYSSIGELDHNIDPQVSKAWRWGHDVAWAFVRYENPDKDVVYRHLNEVLGNLRQAWQDSVVAQQKHLQREKLSAELAGLRARGFNILQTLLFEIFKPTFITQSFSTKKYYLRSAINVLMRTADKMPTSELINYVEKLIVIDHEDARKAMYAFRWRKDPESFAYIKKLTLNDNFEIQRNALFILPQMPSMESVSIKNPDPKVSCENIAF